MKTHDQTDMNTQVPQGSGRSGGAGTSKQKNSLLTGIGAVLVVAVLIALSVTVFTVWRGAKGPGNAPPQGTWKTVLNGYVVSSLVTAKDNPAIVYVCAAYTGNTNTISSDVSYKVSRSSDSGNTWQTSQASGSDSSLQGFCQLAINPSNSNDVYAVGGVANAQGGVVPMLKHSTDGGQNWETIQPRLHFPLPGPAQTTIDWQVRSISVVGKTLFGLQWVAGHAGPPRVSGVKSGPSLPTAFYAIPHLTESTDGGHNWSVLDKNIGTTPLAVRSYVVDPTNAQTIYALLDTPVWPVGGTSAAANDGGPTYGMNGTLYKTTNGGNTWTPILKNLRYGTEVQLASGNPNVLYVGGLNMPMPVGVQPAMGVDQGQSTTSASPTNKAALYGSFHLQVSQDGGASWHGVAATPGQFAIQSWFVAADGQVYAASNYADNVTPGGTPQATTSVRTVVPSGTTSVNGQASTAGQANTPSTVTPGNVLRYDPTKNSWQHVTTLPAPGSLFNVTPASGNGGAVLWMTGAENGKAVLSRYVA